MTRGGYGGQGFWRQPRQRRTLDQWDAAHAIHETHDIDVIAAEIEDTERMMVARVQRTGRIEIEDTVVPDTQIGNAGAQHFAKPGGYKLYGSYKDRWQKRFGPVAGRGKYGPRKPRLTPPA
jgi:hypothetical protein